MVFGLIHWALIVLAVVYLVTESAVFAPLRIAFSRGSWIRAGLFYCPACFGFWTGCALHVLWPYVASPLRVGGVSFGTLFHAIDSGLAALVLGALWGTVTNPTSFEAERGILQLPGDE